MIVPLAWQMLSIICGLMTLLERRDDVFRVIRSASGRLRRCHAPCAAEVWFRSKVCDIQWKAVAGRSNMATVLAYFAAMQQNAFPELPSPYR